MNNLLNDTLLREKTDYYVSKWRWILATLILFFLAGFLFLRYTNHEYKTTATLKFQEDSKANQLPELSQLQNSGLFAQGLNKVDDEIKILTSKTLIEQVVRDLKLNTKYYILGNVKATEYFNDQPISITFFENDSIINNIDGSLILKVISPTKFSVIESKSNHVIDNTLNERSEHLFGEKFNSHFGEVIITPNIGNENLEIGSNFIVELTSIDKLVEYYTKKIKVQAAQNSSIIYINLNDHIKQRGELFVNKLIEVYNKDVVNDKEGVVKVTSDFINNRLNIVSDELQQVDLTAENIKKSNRLSNLASQSSIFLQNEKENEAKLIATTNQMQLIDYMSDYVADDSRDSDLLPANVGINDNGVAQLTKSHNELVLQRDRILRNSSEKNPTVINLNNQINALKANLNQTLDNLKSSTEITLKSLSAEESRINSQIYSAPQKERQFRDITRQQSIKESLYLYLLQKREETAIMFGMSTSNAKIVDAAFSSKNPVNPKPFIVYLAALILGLIVPLIVLYISDLLNTKVQSKLDLAPISDIPFIGDIPKSSSKKNKRLVSKIDYSPKAEAFRMIRTNIEFILKGKKDKQAKTIFVTSTKAQEGKSHTSINLASSISFSGKKVLLVETDIRVPKVEDYLNVKNKQGLTDFINDDSLSIADVTTIIKDNDNLHVIPSGTIPPNPSELLMSERIHDLFNQVKKNYDYIIVDTAAVGLVTDTLLISDHADMFIYVVSVNNLDKRQLHVAKTMFDEKRLPNMAMLLNGTIKKSGYGYGYGYGTKPKKKKWFSFS
ncbi:GumC family protein [Pontimicrobium sp. IMCC45349]|uniref:GumC family protein n=1 Tax=Pontimicrobium sp. IMCC45349 TaxID=3391574 RepID=UPI0039A225A5